MNQLLIPLGMAITLLGLIVFGMFIGWSIGHRQWLREHPDQ